MRAQTPSPPLLPSLQQVFRGPQSVPKPLTAPTAPALRPTPHSMPFTAPTTPSESFFKKYLEAPMGAQTPSALTALTALTAPPPPPPQPPSPLRPHFPHSMPLPFSPSLPLPRSIQPPPHRPHRPQRFAHTAPTLCPHQSWLHPPPPTTSPPTVPIAHTALTLATPSQCFAHSLHGFRPHCPHQPECPNPSSSGFPEAEHGVSPNTSPHHAGLELELPQMLAADWTCNQHS